MIKKPTIKRRQSVREYAEDESPVKFVDLEWVLGSTYKRKII